MATLYKRNMKPITKARPLQTPSYRTEYADDPPTGMALAYLTGDYALKAIAREFGVHYATVSRAVKAYESTHGE